MFRGVYLKELLKPALSIYYIRDNLIIILKAWCTIRKETIKSANLVVSNSPYLRDYAKPLNSNSLYGTRL
jgi:hypothetical protein